MSERKNKSKVKAPPPLPKQIRNKIRMSVALRGYAEMKCGWSMHLHDQHNAMAEFFHGKEPSHPPQIKLFAEAQLNYRNFFDSKIVQSTTKNDDTTSVTRFHLKTKLTQKI